MLRAGCRAPEDLLDEPGGGGAAGLDDAHSNGERPRNVRKERVDEMHPPRGDTRPEGPRGVEGD